MYFGCRVLGYSIKGIVSFVSNKAGQYVFMECFVFRMQNVAKGLSKWGTLWYTQACAGGTLPIALLFIFTKIPLTPHPKKVTLWKRKKFVQYIRKQEYLWYMKFCKLIFIWNKKRILALDCQPTTFNMYWIDFLYNIESFNKLRKYVLHLG